MFNVNLVHHVILSYLLMQEHCHSPLDNYTGIRYYLERWNRLPPHITVVFTLPLRWTDGTVDSGVYSSQLEVQVQS